MLTYIWFTSPFCQFPNRGSNQCLSPEQKMKNYVDENHDAYKDANKEFYHYYCEFDWGKLNQKLKPYDERRRQLNRTAYERNVLGKHDQDTSSASYWPDGKVMPL